jgi:glycosyl transferase, family 25
MRAQAARLGIEFTRVPGVDGLALPDNMRAEFLDGRGCVASKLIVGEVGCYASHMRAWEHVIDNRLPYAMVLEDDVRCQPELAEIADVAVRTAPPAGT